MVIESRLLFWFEQLAISFGHFQEKLLLEMLIFQVLHRLQFYMVKLTFSLFGLTNTIQ